MRSNPVLPPPRPIDDSYVVPGTRLIAGEYPGSAPSVEPAKAAAKLEAFLAAGVDVFVDLTAPEDRLTPYHEPLCALAGDRPLPVHLSMPIRDMGTCDAAAMTRILDVIDSHLDAGRTVYVHCWGGVGRTGTIVGCWLVRHGHTGDAALEMVAALFAQMSPKKLEAHRAWGSPQTDAQRAMVRTWAESADAPSGGAGGAREGGSDRTDHGDERLFPLACEGAIKTWLDLQTGRLVAAPIEGEADSSRAAGGRLPIAGTTFDPADNGELMQVIAATLDEQGFVWAQPTQISAILEMAQEHAVYDLLLLADEEARIVTCYCRFGSRVPPARRAAVAEAVARANFGMRLGCFELDLDDGEIRFRTAVDLLGSALEPPMVLRMMGIGIQCAEQYHDALMQVAFGGVDPEVAIGEVEGGGG